MRLGKVLIFLVVFLNQQLAFTQDDEHPEVTLNFEDALRVGVTTANKDRKQELTATATPKDKAGSVSLTSSANLKISDVQPDNATGIIKFKAEGIKKTDPQADNDWIKAKLNSATDQKKVRSIVPAKIDTGNLPQFNGPVQGQSVALSSTTSPPAAGPGIGPNQVLLASSYLANLNVPVLDQFGTPCGDLYKDAPVYENLGQWVNINSPLKEDSTYGDKTGIVINRGLVPSGSVAIGLWLASPPDPMGNPPPSTDVFSVKIDEFELNPGVNNRKVKFQTPNNIIIEWNP